MYFHGVTLLRRSVDGHDFLFTKELRLVERPTRVYADGVRIRLPTGVLYGHRPHKYLSTDYTSPAFEKQRKFITNRSDEYPFYSRSPQNCHSLPLPVIFGKSGRWNLRKEGMASSETGNIGTI